LQEEGAVRLAESVAWFLAHPDRMQVAPELETRVDRILDAWHESK